MRGTRLLWLALVVALFCLPLFVGLGGTDLQNDEAIYSYAVRSILETGDWLNPKSSPSSDIVFVEKPPLKFWLVALPIRLGLLPNDEFGLRFWDAVLGGIAFLYVFSIGRRMAGPLCGLVACFVLFGFHPLLFDHGLRSNNMEAPLLLAYCGGVYHYLRWAGASHDDDDGVRHEAAGERRHAFAVGLYIVLGFMTKFVAVVFLPLVLGAATLAVPAVRSKARAAWRLWLQVAVLGLVLVAPWFVYETIRSPREFWRTILWEHVYVRFSASLDRGHVQPWDFYISFFQLFLLQERIFRMTVFAGLVVLVRAVWTRWLEGIVIVAWFALPVILISFGTSKLGHYAYAFLPPVGLSLGYLLAGVARTAIAIGSGTPPAWLEGLAARGRSARLFASARRLLSVTRTHLARGAGLPGVRPALRLVQLAGTLLGAWWLVLALISLVHWGRLEIGGLVLARNPQPLKLATNALLLGLAIGRARWALRFAVPIVVIALAPVTAYHERLAHLTVEHHQLRHLSACLGEVREAERQAGRATREMYVLLPEGFVHPYFFYFRAAGWEQHENVPNEALAEELDKTGPPRPFLLSADPLRPVWQPRVNTAAYPGWTVVNEVVLLLPGPFRRCESY
jgi:hypothetical protein